LEEEFTTLWIDPLDGTLAFTKNELEAVTNLIGITYHGKATLGIIG
jgi:fructose-1,6-bisphosphatase/inositol monophosphatase family enzyme